MDKLIGTVLIVALILCGLFLIINNLETRFDEFMRPTGIEPFPPTGVTAVIWLLLLPLAGGVYYIIKR